MSKQVAIIGLGTFGTCLALTLRDAGYEVMAIDQEAEPVENISSEITHAVRANATSELALQKLGIKNVDVAVVAVGASIQNSVMITILLKKMGVRYIVARADNELHGAILNSIGADKIIFPERDIAVRTGPILTMRDVADFIPLDKGSGIVKAKATPYFIGKTLSDLGLGPESKSGAAVLMIQRGKEGILNPSAEEVISHIDVLIIAGNTSDIDKLLDKADKAEEESKENGNKNSNH
jgi:trk system potassium uptake protein TrkA